MYSDSKHRWRKRCRRHLLKRVFYIFPQRLHINTPNVFSPVAPFWRYLFSSSISPFYKLQPDHEYICSKPEQSGMHLCGGLPEYINGTMKCNLTIEQKYSFRYVADDSVCINWNLYYTDCREGPRNPFKGTISFDNIGLAWVSIFLVNILCLLNTMLPKRI